MNNTQRFLYTQAARPLLSGYVERSNKDSEIINYNNIFLRSTFKESIVCEGYDMSIPAYSVEVDTESFWKFLYSNKWKDCCMIRVKPGLLNSDLTMILTNLLKNKQISSHTTVGFLKIKPNEVNRLETQKNGTIRLEFTYFGKNVHYIPKSKSAESELSTQKFPWNLTTNYKIEKPEIYSRRFTAQDKIKSIRLINANLAHFQRTEPINLVDVLDTDVSSDKLLALIKSTNHSSIKKQLMSIKSTNQSPIKNPLMSIKSTNQSPIKNGLVSKRPKCTTKSSELKDMKKKNIQSKEDFTEKIYLQPIDPVDISFEILGHILQEEDRQRSLGYKLRMSKLFLSNKLINKTRQLLNKTNTKVSLGKKKKRPCRQHTSKVNIVEFLNSFVTHDGWKHFSEQVLAISSSQELFRSVLNLRKQLKSRPSKKPYISQKTIEKLDETTKKEMQSLFKNYKKVKSDERMLTDNNQTDENERSDEIFDVYRTNMLSTQQDINNIQKSQEKLLESLGDFVVRQELLCFSNKYSTIRTLVFIRPSLFTEVYF